MEMKVYAQIEKCKKITANIKNSKKYMDAFLSLHNNFREYHDSGYYAIQNNGYFSLYLYVDENNVNSLLKYLENWNAEIVEIEDSHVVTDCSYISPNDGNEYLDNDVVFNQFTDIAIS